MPFPTTTYGLKMAGYVFDQGGTCRFCKKEIEWWKTPRRRLIPMDVNPDGTCVSHFATCPNYSPVSKK